MHAEAATALSGAAAAAFVLDQAIGAHIALEAAHRYSLAGLRYSDFITSILVGTIDDRWAEPGPGDDPRASTAGVADSLVQRVYRALALAVVGDFERAQGLLAGSLDFVEFGPLSLPSAIVRRATEGADGDRWQAIAHAAVDMFVRAQPAWSARPIYKQLMPWEFGIPLDVVLLASLAPIKTHQDPAGRAVASASQALRETIDSGVLRTRPSLRTTLSAWLAVDDRRHARDVQLPDEPGGPSRS